MRWMSCLSMLLFFFNDTATTEIYTLSLHDALPICQDNCLQFANGSSVPARRCRLRSEEHTSELQSLRHLVCRLLLEKKKRLSCARRTRALCGAAAGPAPRAG